MAQRRTPMDTITVSEEAEAENWCSSDFYHSPDAVGGNRRRSE